MSVKYYDNDTLVDVSELKIYQEGGGDPTLIEKSVTQNGTYDAADDNADGYSSVTVNVSGGSATLVDKTISVNGTYDPSDDNADGYSEVTVAVPEPTLTTKTITTNGTYDPGDDNADGYSEVTVDLPLDTKSIVLNGTYNATDDNLEGYSSISVHVPASSDEYYGTGTVKTFADTNFKHASFSTADYGKTEAVPAMFLAAANEFDFDSVSTPSTTETLLTYGNATARAYEVYSDNPGATLEYAGDYFRFVGVLPWEAQYVISSKAALLTIPRGGTGSELRTYMAFGFGRMGVNSNAKAAVWSTAYESSYRTAFSWGIRTQGYYDLKPTGFSSNKLLIPLGIDGLYQLAIGQLTDEGLYEIDGEIFYISGGIAIKDE